MLSHLPNCAGQTTRLREGSRVDDMVGTARRQLMELDLSLPQAPGEMTQLPVIKAEPQEVNQFLKVTPGKCVQGGILFLCSTGQRASLLQ